ncbi:MAG: recombinase family protein [Desulfuromonadaceae bacterium]|nr:recombinase family protein [Desulfuromonadaceae bacterium]
MPESKFVSYMRVSTLRQGISGLGLDAQKKAIADYISRGSWELIAEFVEIESGKVDNRKELQKALHLCLMTGATLVIAKLDRLSRDLHFISSIQKSNIEFIACDMPAANRFTIHILAAVAEHERYMISQRTKAALQAAKARGTKLGNHANLTTSALIEGRKLGVIARKKKADDFASQIAQVINDFMGQGLTLAQTAAELNSRNILTSSGKIGRWSATTVRNVVIRIQSLDQALEKYDKLVREKLRKKRGRIYMRVHDEKEFLCKK